MYSVTSKKAIEGNSKRLIIYVNLWCPYIALHIFSVCNYTHTSFNRLIDSFFFSIIVLIEGYHILLKLEISGAVRPARANNMNGYLENKKLGSQSFGFWVFDREKKI